MIVITNLYMRLLDKCVYGLYVYYNSYDGVQFNFFTMIISYSNDFKPCFRRLLLIRYGRFDMQEWMLIILLVIIGFLCLCSRINTGIPLADVMTERFQNFGEWVSSVKLSFSIFSYSLYLRL